MLGWKPKEGEWSTEVPEGTVVVIICALVAVGAIGFTLLVRERDIPPAPVENPELKHQETRRQVLLENLKDLQFEYLQGKLSDGDYQSLKAGFLYDLAGVMDSIERLQSKAQESRDPRLTGAGRERAVRSPLKPSKGPELKTEADPRAKTKVKTKQVATAGTEIKCPSCASPNPPSNRFCGHCGAALA